MNYAQYICKIEMNQVNWDDEIINISVRLFYNDRMRTAFWTVPKKYTGRLYNAIMAGVALCNFTTNINQNIEYDYAVCNSTVQFDLEKLGF